MSQLRRVSLTRSGPLGIALCLAALAGFGCSQENEAAALRALQPAGEISILCLGRGDDGTFTEGLPRGACPDFEGIALGRDERHLMALVTQPANGEVALVDLGVSSNPVIDFEPSQPGYSFLPVGAEPTAIVSTPGGLASFVSVRETGREGVFALPSSCIGPHPADSPLRDLRTWPACRLPAAPGPMALLEDPALDHDQDPATPDRVRERCGADYVEADTLIGAALAASREQCPADLAREASPSGRRKLAVTLPSLAEVWVLDAQELLDRAPGSFDDCLPETRVELQLDPDVPDEAIPADLQPSAPSCAPVGFEHGPTAAGLRPWPADLALDDAGLLYLADSQAPLIHRLDVSDPCSLAALPPLHPRSYSDPNALITTRKLAVSPLTPFGKRFVYAVDDSTTSTAGTLIAFDVSPGSSERTPIVRERASFTPNEPPDRILLPRDVADVEFVFQDFPVADGNGNVAIEGIACDPLPLSAPSDSAAARYRPAPDGSSGARPTKLRGTFAFAALHSGQLAVVDVEDLDAACRRPRSFNLGSEEDLRGCRNDDPSLAVTGFFDGNTRTVSDELSCNLIVPHRARSRTFFTNLGASRSAGLLAFPALTLANGRSVATDQSDEGRAQPKLLGSRFAPAEPAELYVGPLLYSTEAQGDHLELDPGRAERSSLLLSYEEPRAYIPGEDFLASYEGVVRAQSEAIFRAPESGSSLGIVDEGLNASFCGGGVQDLDLTLEVGRGLGLSDPATLAQFARRHADYVRITAPLLDTDDAYWQAGSAGAQCGSELFADSSDGTRELRGRALCEQFFGRPEEQATDSWRDLRIVEASEDRLLVEPRQPLQSSENRRRQLMQFVSCCFPEPTAFVVRAGHQWVVRGGATGVGHHVTTDPATGRCVNDCNPRTQRLTGRAFEISCTANCPVDDQGRTSVGLARPGEDFVCMVDDPTGGVEAGEPGSECVFQSVTSRFAIYRGQERTLRDTRFRWLLSDGFAPLTLSLANAERGVSSPRSLFVVPELGQLLVTDGIAPGVTQVQTTSLNLTTATIF